MRTSSFAGWWNILVDNSEDQDQMCNTVEKALELAESDVAQQGGDVAIATQIANFVRAECGRPMLGAKEIVRAAKDAQ